VDQYQFGLPALQLLEKISGMNQRTTSFRAAALPPKSLLEVEASPISSESIPVEIQ
jgi:hypothetical protein